MWGKTFKSLSGHVYSLFVNFKVALAAFRDSLEYVYGFPRNIVASRTVIFLARSTACIIYV